MSSGHWMAIFAITMLFSIWNGFQDECNWFQHRVSTKSIQIFGKLIHFNIIFVCNSPGDHTASLWQLRESKFEHVRSFHGHNRSVKTAAFRKFDPTCFATGGRDNAILIWDIRSRSNIGNVPKADNCIMSGHTGGPGTPAANRRRTTRHTPRTPSNIPSNSITGLVFEVSRFESQFYHFHFELN